MLSYIGYVALDPSLLLAAGVGIVKAMIAKQDPMPFLSIGAPSYAT